MAQTKKYIMSVTAQDRAGIVAGVGEAGLALGGNIEAASQTVHQGYFAMMILWSLPADVTTDQLVKAVRERTGADLHVYVTPYEPSAAQDTSQMQSFVITSLGPDKPGILHTLSAYLASKRINIDDLYATVKGEDFVVICQVAVPVELDVFMLQADLESVGRSLGLTIQMQHEDIFVATNELSLRRQQHS